MQPNCLSWLVPLLCSFLLPEILFAQEKPLPLVDFHVYSTHKPFKSRAVLPYNIWEDIEHDCAQGLSEELQVAFANRWKQSQSNLVKMIRGGVTLSKQVIAPTEAQLYKNPAFGNASGADYFACITGEQHKRSYFVNSYVPYFNELVEHIRFLQKESEYNFYLNGRSFNSKVIYTVADVEEALNDPTVLGLLLSIEGGHSLAQFYSSEENQHYLEQKQFQQEVLLNVARLKGLEPLQADTEEYLTIPIFSISFSNYFEDGICGKARLLSPEQEAVLGVQTSLGKGFSSTGKRVVQSLCDRKEGRRILIDVSGMSQKSRQWYYDYLRDQRYNKDTIPALASHVGISGLSWNDADYTDDYAKLMGQEDYFNNREANLARQDILKISESDGLIGIALDKAYLLGPEFQERYDRSISNSAERRDIAVEAIVANICRVIFTVQNIEAWDKICISSKFDGPSQPFDAYSDATKLHQLGDDLLAFFQNPRDIPGVFTAEQIELFMYNYEPEILVRKLLYENATRFIKQQLQELSPQGD